MKEANFPKRLENWKSIISDQRASGLSQTNFCIDRGISKSSFNYWSSVLRKKKILEKNPPSFLAVEVARKVEVPLKIVFPSGTALHLATTPDAEWLAQIMRLIS